MFLNKAPIPTREFAITHTGLHAPHRVLVMAEVLHQLSAITLSISNTDNTILRHSCHKYILFSFHFLSHLGI